MMVIFIFAVVLFTVQGSLQITFQYSLMHCNRITNEEHSNAVPPLVTVLPIAVKDATREEVGYLIEELHTSGRCTILVYEYNVSNNMKRIM
jgi:hypothetical protein